MNAVVEEEYKTSFSSNDPGVSKFCSTGHQNGNENHIVLQNVYYSPQKEQTKLNKLNRQAEIPKCNLRFRKPTMIPKVTTASDLCSTRNLQDRESASRYYKLQESNDCEFAYNHRPCTEVLHAGRPNTTPNTHGISVFTSLQGEVNSGLHELSYKQTTPAHPKLPRHFLKHPNFDNQIGGTSFWRTINGFEEEFPLAVQSQFTVRPEGRGGPFLSYKSFHNTPEHSVHHLKTRATWQTLQRHPTLESKASHRDLLNQASQTPWHQDVNSFHNKEPIVNNIFNHNPNITKPHFAFSWHTVSGNHCGSGAGKAMVTFDEALVESSLITMERSISPQSKDMSISRGIDGTTQAAFNTDKVNYMGLPNQDKNVTISIETCTSNSSCNTVFTRKVPASFIADNLNKESVERQRATIDPSSTMLTSNLTKSPRDCSLRGGISQLVVPNRPNQKSNTKENLGKGPESVLHEQSVAKSCTFRVPLYHKDDAGVDLKTQGDRKTQAKSFDNTSSVSEPASDTVNPKIFKCSFIGCTKQFVKKSLLLCHQKFHTGERPYRCPWKCCRKKFRRCDDRRRHYRCHTGEKPYKCPRCDRPFSRSDHLRSHLRKIHRLTFERWSGMQRNL